MFRITLKEVAAHIQRYAMTALAVMLGVAFIAGTLVFTDTIHQTFNSLYDTIYQSTAAVVRARQTYQPTTNFTSQRQLIPADLASVVERVPGVVAVAPDIQGYAQLVGRNGEAIGNPAAGAPTIGGNWVDIRALNQLRLLPGGRPPTAANDIVVDEHSAQKGDLHVGDSVLVLTKQASARYTISGIATWAGQSSPLGATIIAFTYPTAQKVLTEPGQVNQLDVEGATGVSQDQLVQRISAALHDPSIEVVTGQAVTQEGQNAVHQSLGLFNTILLVFAIISLFVGSFLIFNTFSILVAQRTRELALLRAVGASRAQMTRSVLGESVVVGLGASAAGLGAGFALAIGLRGLLDALGFTIPSNGLVLEPRTVIVALVVGTVITVLAALFPARRAARTPPVAAINEAASDASVSPTRRGIAGGTVTAVGTALLCIGLFAHLSMKLVTVGGGAAIVFIGLAMLGPFLAKPLVGAIGRPFARFGMPGALARQNAMRNPGRTAATAAALMVGVALVTVISIIAASEKSSVDATLNNSLRADFIVNSGAQTGGESGLSPTLEQSIARLRGVAAVGGIRGSLADVYGSTTPVIATDPRTVDQLFNVGLTAGDLGTMTRSGIGVSTTAANAHHLRLGSVVDVTFPTTGRQAFTVQVIYSNRDLAGDYVLTLLATKTNFANQLDEQIYVRLKPGVSAASARSALTSVLAAYPSATLLDEAQFKAQIASQIDQQLNLMYGLLGLAVVIALIGIANTLALSIFERRRELGVLRAVGMTQRQLRSSVRVEAMIVSLLGAVEGLVVGSCSEPHSWSPCTARA